MRRCTHIWTDLEAHTCTRRQFIDGNTANENAWPGWTARVLAHLDEFGWAATDAGNGGLHICLSVKRNGIELADLSTTRSTRNKAA